MPAALGRGWDGTRLGQHQRGLGNVPGWMLDKDKAGSHCFPLCFLLSRLEGLSCFMEKGSPWQDRADGLQPFPRELGRW